MPVFVIQGKPTRREGSRGAAARGRRGSRGGVQHPPQLQVGELSEPNKSEEVEEQMSNRDFAEDEFNLEEICQCEGIPGREPENDTFVSVLVCAAFRRFF